MNIAGFLHSPPLHNFIGFGGADWVELFFVVLFLAVWCCRNWLVAFSTRLAHCTAFCMLLLGLLPVVLRVALLPQSPVPVPNGADDFSYLLLGDTLAHFRLANPSHPLFQFFETVFVFQQPTYSSIFPPGQGIALAFGELLFATPWAGVLLSVACLCALSYWMLRASVPPVWALFGGILAIIEFGPLCQWTNSYWGGAVSATAGCLVFGSLPRIVERARPRDALLLGAGLGLQFVTRPFEFLFLFVAAIAFLLPHLRTRFNRNAAPLLVLFATVPLLAAVALTLAQNKAVTHHWTTLPYMLSRYQYGVPTTFTWQPNPVPHRRLTPEQDLDYRAQSIIHRETRDTLTSYFRRLFFRIRYYRFFFLPPLYIALIAFCFRLRSPRELWALATVLLFALGTNFYPYFYPHYIAALSCLFLLITIQGLRTISKVTVRGYHVGPELSFLIGSVCAFIFLFWYALHLLGPDNFEEAMLYETWNYINYGDAEGRLAVNNQLEGLPGKQLVFVHYSPQHRFREWIHNAANIDDAQIVWARDLGPAENRALIHYYNKRKVWLLQPDAEPPVLTPYTPAPNSGSKAFESISP